MDIVDPEECALAEQTGNVGGGVSHIRVEAVGFQAGGDPELIGVGEFLGEGSRLRAGSRPYGGGGANYGGRTRHATKRGVGGCRRYLGTSPGRRVTCADLAMIPNEVMWPIANGVFHCMSGVLTSAAAHYPNLDFQVVGGGYIAGLSLDRVRELGRSLELFATAV